MSGIYEHKFTNPDLMVTELCKRISMLLESAVAQRGRAELLVSGGRTPKPLYTQLSGVDLPWEYITVALVDERWVGVDHEASNEAFIRQNLLKGRASRATFIGMKNSASSPREGLAECENQYASLSESPDVCVLGMGSDGHTASLFPRAQGLENALVGISRCAAVISQKTNVTGAYTERMSLTMPYILSASHRFLMITGDEKFDVYRHACSSEDVACVPVAGILQPNITTDVYWAS